MTIDVLFAGIAVAELDAAKAWYRRLFGRAAAVIASDDEVMWQGPARGGSTSCVTRDALGRHW